MTHVGALTLLKTYKRNTSAIEEIDISVSVFGLRLEGVIGAFVTWKTPLALWFFFFLRPVCFSARSLHAAAGEIPTQCESPVHRPELCRQEFGGLQDL